MRKKITAFMLAIGMILGSSLGNDAVIAGESKINASEEQVAVATISSFGDELTHDPKYETYEKINGIDVSKWQGNIDWKKVKSAGISFAILRLGYRSSSDGKIYLDSYFHANMKGAHEAGIDIGVYFYTQAITDAEAKEEADFAVKQLQAYPGYLTFPVFYDIENTATDRMGKNKVTTKLRTSMSKKFCETVKSKGYIPGIYASYLYFLNSLYVDELEKYDLWLARYANAPVYKNNYFPNEYSMWQYSSTGKVDGISGNVDMDVYYQKSAPGKISGLKQTGITESMIALSWDSVPFASGYQIQRMDETGAEIDSQMVTENSFYLEMLNSGTMNQFKVRAYYLNSDGSTTYGSYSSVLKGYTLPGRVSGIAQKECNSTSATIEWNTVPGAVGYQIRIYDPATGKYTAHGSTTQNVYKVTGLAAGSTSQISIRPYVTINGSTKNYGADSELYTIATGIDQVTKVKVLEQKSDSVTISWALQDKVEGYEVVCYDEDSNLISTELVKVNSYTKTGLDSATEYLFEVRAYISAADGTNVYGSYSEMYGITTLPEQVKKLSAGDVENGKIVLSWNEVDGVDGYRVYQYNADTQKSTLLKSVTDSEYTVSKIENGKVYYYKVAAYVEYDGTKYEGKPSNILELVMKPDQVTGIVMKSNSSDTIKLTWNSMSGVTGYEIACYDRNGKLVGTNIAAQNVYIWGNLENASMYSFKVRAFVISESGKKKSGTYSSKIKMITKPHQVLGLKLAKASKSSVKVSWKKQDRISGYKIYLYNKKTGKNTYIASTTSNSYTVKGLKSVTDYNVCVKSYIKWNGMTYYGAMSNKLQVKTR